MMSGYGGRTNEIRQDYFQWLSEMMHVETGVASYWLLFHDLHSIPFVSLVDHDDNRAADGIALRERYFDEMGYWNYEALDGPCSVLEMMIALAEAMDFEMSDAVDDIRQPAKYFWEMLENLDLIKYSDDAYVHLDGLYNVKGIVDDFLNRNYMANGRGGLFPLKHTSTDQRDVEIWYQMAGYLRENYA